MLFRRFPFAPFHRPQSAGRLARSALARALYSAIAMHSLRRLRELFELHAPADFARALALLPLRAQLDALSMLALPARLQLWPYLPCALRRALRPLPSTESGQQAA